MGVTYDTGALIAAERDDRALWALHRRALEQRMRPVIPAAVLAQAWRGGPQAELSRLLRGCRIEDLTDARARQAGAACAQAGTTDIVDSCVVIGATARGDVVVTSDAEDLHHLARAIGLALDLHAI